MTNLSTRCVIAGGGPAGMMCGYLLARAGVDVIVLEKHKDFLRDFRGDTVHPSTLEVMHELGLLEDFLKLPHEEYDRLDIELGDTKYKAADFRRLPTMCKFIAFLPQWDFLSFLAERAKAFPNFRLLMETEAAGLLRDGEDIAGVRTKDGAIAAKLVIAADGRGSILRDAAGFKVENLGAPMDVLWFRLDPIAQEEKAALGRIIANIETSVSSSARRLLTPVKGSVRTSVNVIRWFDCWRISS